MSLFLSLLSMCNAHSVQRERDWRPSGTWLFEVEVDERLSRHFNSYCGFRAEFKVQRPQLSPMPDEVLLQRNVDFLSPFVLLVFHLSVPPSTLTTSLPSLCITLLLLALSLPCGEYPC